MKRLKLSFSPLRLIMPRLAQRTESITPFHAVELFKQANALMAQGRDIISLGIGEPDFTAPARVVEALNNAAAAGLSGYSAPSGLPALRESVAHYYAQQFGAIVDPSRVVITSGASGALLLACMALVNPGDHVMMPDPSYPANQNFVRAAGGVPQLVPSTPDQRFQLSADHVRSFWTDQTRGVLVASPSNPTGTSISRTELAELIREVRARDGFIIMDEIYLGLYYDDPPKSALTLDDDIIILNSFSKYFHMTGWRLGWMIIPPYLTDAVDKLSANLAICAPTLAQHAALACFDPDVMQLYEKRRLSFKQRRDYLVPALERLGLRVPVHPDGAFYIYADIRRFSHDSDAFSQRLLLEAGVAAVPGRDFGPAHAGHMMRFSYATGLDRLQEAIARMEQFLGTFSR